MIESCPVCGGGHASHSCTHAQDTDCHRNPLMACPTHFAHASADALEAAVGHSDLTFVTAMKHLNGDGCTFPAFYTWMALLGRYAVPEGTNREAYLASASSELPPVPDGSPDYLEAVARRLSFASRAAVVNDGPTVAATLATVEELSADATVSFLKSVAASAHLAVDANDACTSDDVQLYHLLGSQVTEERGFMALPWLADMVKGQWRGDVPLSVGAWTELMRLSDLHPTFMAVVVDVVSRALGQMLSPTATLVTTGGQRLAEGFVPTGLVDVNVADPANTAPEVMAGVWAARAAEAYAQATGREDATARIQAVGAAHPGGTFAFAVDVVLAGTSMLGYALEEQDHRDAAAEPGD